VVAGLEAPSLVKGAHAGHAEMPENRAEVGVTGVSLARRADPRHCVELLDRLESPVLRAVVEDLLTNYLQTGLFLPRSSTN
jgi:hypothetical protein